MDCFELEFIPEQVSVGPKVYRPENTGEHVWRQMLVSKILAFAVVSVAIYFLIALGFVASQRSRALDDAGGLDFTSVTASGTLAPPRTPVFNRESFIARDGVELTYTHVKAENAASLPLIIMIHGSGWYGGQFDRLSWALRDVAEIKALTLRGHGENAMKRGDLNYIGQFEDDIADLMADDPRKPILLGHSSGGGLVVRFAGSPHGERLGGAILLAPFLQHDAPTTKPNSGGWAHVLTRRIIGLSMLNAVGIHWLDHLTVIQFNMPREVLDGPRGAFATTSYSWRLNTSFAPRRSYVEEIAQLPPFLLVAGAEDEAMWAEKYALLMSGATDRGRYEIVEGLGHLDIVDAPETEALIREYLRIF